MTRVGYRVGFLCLYMAGLLLEYAERLLPPPERWRAGNLRREALRMRETRRRKEGR